ncbi:MAG: hypothetical protein JOZ19_14340 [Rubrobacter sp.]|nr:hypothetical protein [Rubrobacter sp.]
MQSHKTSSRPIRVVGLLLILQAIGLVGIIAYGLAQVDWQQVRSDSQQEGLVLQIEPDSPQQQVLVAGKAIGVAILFSPSIILATIGALSFILFSRRGWLLASLAQTLGLGACLELYYEPFWDNPGFVYPIMLYCTLMILYLNSAEVRVVFHSKPEPAQSQGAGAEGST